MKTVLRTFSTPRTVYKNILKVAKKFNKTLIYKIKKLTSNSCLLEIRRKAIYNDKIKPYEKSINIYNEQLHINLLQQIPKLIFNRECARYIPVKSTHNGDDFFAGKFIWAYKLKKITIMEFLLLFTSAITILSTNLSYKYFILLF